MSGMIGSCRIKTNAAGDWLVLPPAGQITQIGDAGATSRGLVNNDDLFVSGKLEVDGFANLDAGVAIGVALTANCLFVMPSEFRYFQDQVSNGGYLQHDKDLEEVTIAVGNGMAGVNSAGNLAVANSVIVAVGVRITQAPGGGATTVSVGRTGGNTDEFIQTMAVAAGTRGTSAANGDGVNAGPVHNAAANTFVITTDANVTISDMKIRIAVWSRVINAPTA